MMLFEPLPLAPTSADSAVPLPAAEEVPKSLPFAALPAKSPEKALVDVALPLALLPLAATATPAAVAISGLVRL